MRNFWVVFSLIIVFTALLTKNMQAQSPVNHIIDSLKNKLKTAGEDTSKVKILAQLSKKESINNPPEAVNDGKLALQLAQKLNWKKGCFLGYSMLGNAYMVSSNFPAALQNLKMAVGYSDAEEDKQLIANNLTRIGNVYFYTADYSRSLEFYRQALDIDRAIGNKKIEAATLNNMGGVLKELCDYSKALEYYLQALKIDREINNKESEATDIGNIGNIHADMGDTAIALNYYNQSLQMNRALGDKMAEEADLGNIGTLYGRYGNHKKGLVYDSQALQIAIQIDDKQGQSLIFGNIGSDYIDLFDYPKALDYLQKAMKMNVELEDKNDEADNLNKIGVAYFKLANYPQAIEYENKSLKLSKEIGAFDLQSMVFKSYWEIYRKSNKPALALEAYERYIILRDSLVNVNKQKEITRKQMQFDFDAKEAAAKAEQAQKDIITHAEFQKDRLERNGFIGGGIFLLLLCGTLYYGYRRNRKQNILLAAQKAEIEARDKEKELLLRELHHRVKNNLQIVSSLLSLQSNQIQDDVSRQAFREGQSRVEAMSLIHQRLYLGDKLSTIDIQEYLKNLVHSVSGSYGYSSDKYNLVFNVEQVDLDVEIAIPLGLIINEILSNCFKHAFKDIGQPRLEMALQKNGDSISLKISDNGVGMPPGMNSGKAKTFGMRLINSLTKQIRGTLMIISKEGSSFEFKFPLGGSL